jgi:hypothetical protein
LSRYIEFYFEASFWKMSLCAGSQQFKPNGPAIKRAER